MPYVGEYFCRLVWQMPNQTDAQFVGGPFETKGNHLVRREEEEVVVVVVVVAEEMRYPTIKCGVHTKKPFVTWQ
jgi:hypothetical protein